MSVFASRALPLACNNDDMENEGSTGTGDGSTGTGCGRSQPRCLGTSNQMSTSLSTLSQRHSKLEAQVRSLKQMKVELEQENVELQRKLRASESKQREMMTAFGRVFHGVMTTCQATVKAHATGMIVPPTGSASTPASGTAASENSTTSTGFNHAVASGFGGLGALGRSPDFGPGDEHLSLSYACDNDGRINNSQAVSPGHAHAGDYVGLELSTNFQGNSAIDMSVSHSFMCARVACKGSRSTA